MVTIEEMEKRINNMARPLIAYQSYRGGIAGQAFTSWNCLRCDNEFVHPNTLTPFICDICISQIKDLYDSGYFDKRKN